MFTKLLKGKRLYFLIFAELHNADVDSCCFFYSRHELLKLYDLNVEVQRKQVQARVLPTPMATFGGRESELGRGKWDANSFLHPANDGRSINWAIVCVLSNERNRCNTSKEVNMLKQQLPRCANSFGVRLSNNPPSENIYPAQIETLLPDLQNNGFELCVLVLYNTKTYPIIKRLSDLHIGLRTQCVKAQTLNKPRVLREFQVLCICCPLNLFFPTLLFLL